MVLECLICPTSKPWSTTLWLCLWDTHWPFWSFFCPWTLPKSVASSFDSRHGLRNSRTLLGLCTSDLPFRHGLYHPLYKCLKYGDELGMLYFWVTCFTDFKWRIWMKLKVQQCPALSAKWILMAIKCVPDLDRYGGYLLEGSNPTTM